MQSKLLSRRDIEFMLYEWLDAEALNRRPRFQDHNRESFDAAIDTAEQIATELFAPHNKKSDQQEPRAVPGERSLNVEIIPEVKTALDAFSAAGLMAAGQDFEIDGMQLPSVVEKVLSAYFTAANVATAAYIFLTVSNANTLLKCGTTCCPCSPENSLAPCACPSRKPAPACPTSRRAPSPIRCPASTASASSG